MTDISAAPTAPRRRGSTAVAAPAPAAPPPASPRTLAIDVGGTGLKAMVLDPDAQPVSDRARVPTSYPCPPEALVAALAALVLPLPPWDRVSVGFPGMVRGGRILSAPHFVTTKGPGTKVSPKLTKAWTGFDLAGALESQLGSPTKLANDADVQGAAVVSGVGLELVLTLGTGMGSALFHEGRLAPHLELAHHPFRKGRSYNDELGEAARKRLGAKKWNRRVTQAVATLDALLFFDRLYIGGGNATRVAVDLGPKATIVANTAGLLGGIRLWDHDSP